MTETTGPETLHIYAQPSHHDDAFIVGTSAALKGLKVQIERLLAAADGGSTTSTYHPFQVSDGEGYRLHLVALPSQEEAGKLATNLWDRLDLPYASEPQTPSPTPLRPYDLVAPIKAKPSPKQTT